jgi:hypothetical protein
MLLSTRTREARSGEGDFASNGLDLKRRIDQGVLMGENAEPTWQGRPRAVTWGK